MKAIAACLIMVTGVMAVPVAPVLAGASVQSGQTATDVGNAICPVMGGPVSGNNFVVFDGKRYGVCCAGCEKEFLKDPSRYIAKVAEEMKTAS